MNNFQDPARGIIWDPSVFTTTFLPQDPVGTYSPAFRAVDYSQAGHGFTEEQRSTTQPVPPLYAPVPLPSAAPILDSHVDFDACSSESDKESIGFMTCQQHDMSQLSNLGNSVASLSIRSTFPTPCELLSAEDLASASSPETVHSHHSLSEAPGTTAARGRRQRQRRVTGPVQASALVPPDADPDGEGITSHDKKRHYLECIENYITYLHERVRELNETPPPFVRVDNYPGLSNPSIRTLLVHMENQAQELNSQTAVQEERFIALRDEVERIEAAQKGLPNLHEPGLIATHLTHSLIPLFKDYAGDPALREYLVSAIDDGILPLPRYISNLLDAARSPDLHTVPTLDTLVRIALDVHYSSGKPHLGSIVGAEDSTVTIIRTVKDAMALLRVAYTLPLSPFHQLTASVSELLVLLFTQLNDFSNAPGTETTQHFTDAHELLHNYQLTPNLRQVLENHVAYLSIILESDVKAIRATLMTNTVQYSLGRGSVFGPNSNSDVITSGLLLNYMVTYRAEEFGAGDTGHAVALLLACFRSSSWSPTAFFTQMFLSAFSCLTQATAYTGLWKAFIVGRFPILLASLAEHVNADTADKIDVKDAASMGLSAAFRRTDVVMQAEHVLSREIPSESTPDDEAPRSLSKELLQAAVKVNFINAQTAALLDPSISNETNPKWYSEAQDGGMDIQSYLEAKLSQDNSIELAVWVERVWRDALSHAIFSKVVLKRFSTLSAALDADALGHWCKMLYSNDKLLDVVALHVKISDLLFYALQFLDNYDCETVGDPQTAVTHFGDVYLFVQYTMTKFKLQPKPITKEGKTISPESFSAVEKLPLDMSVMKAWHKALFESEGIEDSVLRQAKPKVLIHLSFRLLTHCIHSVFTGKLDKEVLMNGVSYFTGPLLSWTLASAIKNLVRDLFLRPPSVAYLNLYCEVIQAIVLSPSCPKVALALTGASILSICNLNEPRRPPSPAVFNVPAIRQVVQDAIISTGGDVAFTTPRNGQSWNENVHQMLQATFSMARLQKSPYLDLKRCLHMVQPTKFLSILWGEVLTAMNLGEVEACRRVITFVLTTPCVEPLTYAPPLLPIFIHTILPSLIQAADKKPPADRTVQLELLTTVISSVLNAALNFEWAARSVAGDDRLLLGQSCASLARRLAADLKRNGKGSEVSAGIIQRLASSQPFVANFPVFMSDISA